MFSEKYIEAIKNDSELTELRKRYYELTGKSASVQLMQPLSVEEWKEELRLKLETLENDKKMRQNS